MVVNDLIIVSIDFSGGTLGGIQGVFYSSIQR